LASRFFTRLRDAGSAKVAWLATRRDAEEEGKEQEEEEREEKEGRKERRGRAKSAATRAIASFSTLVAFEFEQVRVRELESIRPAVN